MQHDRIKPVVIVLRIYEREFTVEAGSDGRLYYLGGRILSRQKLAELVKCEHGCELVEIKDG